MADRQSPGIEITGLTVGYGERPVIDGLDLTVPAGRITTIVGPNASGKSTLLGAVARTIPITAGSVRLDGQDVARWGRRALARRMGLLPQTPIAPEGITVVDLVSRARYPYRNFFGGGDTADADDAVAEALSVTGTLPLASRLLEELSGGQRQRVWLALAIAQRTPLMLLDEPGTYLDLTAQIEVLDILVDLRDHAGRTIVLVLHDLNHAARYADHVVALADGRVAATGSPAEVFTEERLLEVFGLRSRVVDDPVTGTPMIVPIGRHSRPEHETTRPAVILTPAHDQKKVR
ncbi:ATP-binding cassette domain-containing protein [Nakamurella sp. YIM 132087]|uniref:ATP-binding cassette domain-containing protein n=1 Tax=Nakamurella alba TaxID=2665158 RepID=A0A7K1FGT3_9ACTN|nr:ABC transporter ATP-binding protein [Nakamurella alba]MTD13276.1 ATP-binding cassette domain-containing protein [Nakamurella alba]